MGVLHRSYLKLGLRRSWVWQTWRRTAVLSHQKLNTKEKPSARHVSVLRVPVVRACVGRCPRTSTFTHFATRGQSPAHCSVCHRHNFTFLALAPENSRGVPCRTMSTQSLSFSLVAIWVLVLLCFHAALCTFFDTALR